MDVARQPTERNAHEPVPSEAGKNAQYADSDQESVHGAQFHPHFLEVGWRWKNPLLCTRPQTTAPDSPAGRHKVSH